MKPYFIIYYVVAMFAPIIYFTVLTDNTNESNPGLVFWVCCILYALAGFLSSDKSLKSSWKWIAWSIIVGAVEAGVLYWAA